MKSALNIIIEASNGIAKTENLVSVNRRIKNEIRSMPLEKKDNAFLKGC